MNLPPTCPHCFKQGYEYTDLREDKKQPNKIATTLKPSGFSRGRRQGVSLQIYIYIYICIYMCIRICTCICIYILYIYNIYIYIFKGLRPAADPYKNQKVPKSLRSCWVVSCLHVDLCIRILAWSNADRWVVNSCNIWSVWFSFVWYSATHFFWLVTGYI